MKNHSSVKISETILNFGKPLISKLEEDYGKHEFENCMRIVISAWNAVTLDDVQNTDEWTTAIFKQTQNEPGEVVQILRDLVTRKKRYFRDDLRAVGNHWIIIKRGDLVFSCEARDVESKYR